MNDHFGTAMRRAMLSLRTSDVTAATHVIQEALAGRLASLVRLTPASDIAPPAAQVHTKPFEIDADADVVERADAAGSGSRRSEAPLACRWRRPLGETLQLLREGRASTSGGIPFQGLHVLGSAAHAVQHPLPEGAQFEWHTFACVAGGRKYRLYVPASASTRPNGLVVMLHGCKQNPDDFAAGTGMNAVAERHGLLVAYPGQTGTDNASSCWNWFRPQDQERGRGEPAIIAGIASEIMDGFGLGRDQVFVAGLSAGGAMAAVLGETYPDVFSAVGVHSGLAFGSASDVVSAFAAMRGAPGVANRGRRGATAGELPHIRTIVFHGSADRTVHPSNGEKILATAMPSAGETTVRSETGVDRGRNFARTVVEDRLGSTAAEGWMIDGAGHAWSGGQAGGSYADVNGPDASAEMVRFFLGNKR